MKMECFSKLILFLCISYVVYAQDRIPDTCPTKEELRRSGCSIGCITITRESFPCPTCTTTEGCADAVDECRPADATSCGDNQLCLATGAAGRYTCVNLLGDGAPCNVTTDDFDDAIESVRDFLPDLDSRETFDSVIAAVIPCQRGLVCRRVSLTERRCRPEIQGPCTTQRDTDPLVECDDDGEFEPRQCRMDAASGNYRCRCVEPSGVPVPDTEVEVPSRSDAPDCDDIVNDRCKFVSRLGISYEVRSGFPLIDPEQCRRCICDDGEFTLCQDVEEGCQVINPEPREDRSCSLRGRTIEDGDSVEVRCNRCGCRNGVLSCTRRECDDDDEDDDETDIGEDPDDSEEDRNCRRCAAMPAAPVCGSDGRTYPSRCFATQCRGLSADSIIPGPCSRQNICERFPCEDNEFCFRAGGVTCLSSFGCPERLRRCVNPEQLMCRSRDDDGDGDGDETEAVDGDSSGEEETPGEEESESSDGDDEERERVCGSDRRTYPNICTLFQNSVGIQVAYSGSCNRTECLGGMVCGTDGVTYGNICELRTNSANARVDYRGACMDDDDDDSDACQLVRTSGRCADVSDCNFVVRPADSCCPICGGAIVIRLVREVLDEIVRLNPDFETLDDVVKSLIADGFIPDNILRACRVAASILDTAELQLVMENVNRDESTCRDFLDTVADKINNPDTSGTTALPQILQAATVAETASLVDETNGAVKLLPLTLVMMLLPLLALIFF